MCYVAMLLLVFFSFACSHACNFLSSSTLIKDCPPPSPLPTGLGDKTRCLGGMLLGDRVQVTGGGLEMGGRGEWDGGDAAITAGGSGNGPNPPGPTAEAGEARREAEVAPPRAGGGSGAVRGEEEAVLAATRALRGASSAGAERCGWRWPCPAGR